MDYSLMLFAFESAGSMDHAYVAEVAVAYGEHTHEDYVGGIVVNQNLGAALLRSSVAVPGIWGSAVMLNLLTFLLYLHEQGDEGCSEYRGGSE